MLRVATVGFALVATASAGLVTKTMPVDGLLCNGNQTAWVLYPDDGAKYPVVSFAHGLTAQDVETWFPTLLRGIASRGYVVVAPMAGTSWCFKQHQDQIRGIEWAHAKLGDHVDAAAGSAVVGHSMGGGATMTSASDASSIAKWNIKVAVAMHPAQGTNAPKIPILYLTGDADDTVSPSSVRSAYNKAATGVEKVFAEVKGAKHTDATCYGPNKENVFTYDWLDCKMKADGAACTRVLTCKEPKLQVTDCAHDGGSSVVSV